MKNLLLGNLKDFCLFHTNTQVRWKLKVHIKYGDFKSEKDILLICFPGPEIYAVDSICPHSGGPLHVGDIEDLKVDGKWEKTIICPYHEYDFSLSTGKSETHEDFEISTYPVRVVNDCLYIEIEEEDSTAKIVSIERVDLKSHAQAASCLKTPPSYAFNGDEKSQAQNISSTGSLRNPVSITEWAVLILNTPEPDQKVSLTKLAYQWWLQNKNISKIGFCVPPDEPLREKSLKFVEPWNVKNRGKGVSTSSRIALLRKLFFMCNFEIP
jgi:nitrite reductase/ring-hydroxylating ferredoxin subunit